MFKSIHSKILSAQLFLILLTTFSLGIASYLIIIPHLTDNEKEKCEYISRTWADKLEHLISVGKEMVPLRPTTQFTKSLTSFHFEKSGFLSLYDMEGTTIAHPDQKLLLSKVKFPAELQNLVALPGSTLFQRSNHHGIDGFTAYAPVAGSTLVIAATMPYKQFMEVPSKLRRLFLAIISIVALICFLLSARMARGISNPILNLTRITQRLAKGDWNQQIGADTDDEIGALGRSFKQMSYDLHKMIRTRDSEIELRRKIERAIKSSHLELDQIFNTAAGGMAVINLSHEIMRVNDTFIQMMGLKRENVIGRNCHDVFPDRSCGTPKCVLTQMIRKNGRIEKETHKLRSDGIRMICHLVATPHYDLNGELIGIIEDFRDITIAKKTEELVKMSEKRYRLLFNSAPDGISVLNDQGIIIDCNQSLSTIYKRPRTDLIGRHFTHYNNPGSVENCHTTFQRVKEAGQTEGEVQILAPDGTLITLWRKATRICDTKGYFNGVLLYDRDISRQKQTEEIREDMARIARHDLKSPLNGVINLPALIRKEQNLSAKQIKRLDLIEDAGYKMLAMINSSLDLYKMEEGTYKYTPVSVDLCPILNKIGEEVWAEMQANQCSISIFLNGAPAGDLYSFLVWGEELLFYSMLANLVKNAVESSPRAKTISIYLETAARSEIRIHNHGQVPAAIHDRFFQKYVTEGKGGGTGLGTYSARLMARTMKGDIEMVSSPSTGTTVTITMPSTRNGCHRGETASPPSKTDNGEAAKSERLRQAVPLENKDEVKDQGKKVLLAEDDPINQALATAILEEKGFLVTPAVNGRKALELFQENKYDLVLMDMQMPLLNGIETTRFIRKFEGEKNGRTPIIAVTGINNEKNSKVFFEAGIDAVIPKPIQIDLLWETITKYLRSSSTVQ